MNHLSVVARSVMLCALLFSAGCTFDSQSGPSVHYTKSYALSGRATVQLHVRDARVEVITADAPTVDFTVEYEKRDPSAAAPRIASRQDGNRVELSMDEEPQSWWGGNQLGYRHLFIEVRMPRNADLEVQTSNGAIEVADVNGALVLHSSNGPINARQLAGSLDTESSNGAITLERVHGEVKARTSNGAISASGLEGSAALTTSNGRVRVQGRFDGLEIHSSNGGVTARAESGSTLSSGVTITTSNATIDLAVPTTIKASLNLSTSNGAVQLELPVTTQGFESGSDLRGDLNGGGPPISLHTSNGRIRLSGVLAAAGSTASVKIP